MELEAELEEARAKESELQATSEGASAALEEVEESLGTQEETMRGLVAELQSSRATVERLQRAGPGADSDEQSLRAESTHTPSRASTPVMCYPNHPIIIPHRSPVSQSPR